MTPKQIAARNQIVEANKRGLSDQGYDDIWEMYDSPVLQIAYNTGRKGINLASQPTITGHRYGKIPSCGISRNYRDDISEQGVSLAIDKNGNEVGTVVWFLSRPKVTVTGLLMPECGSDGEAVVLPYSVL